MWYLITASYSWLVDNNLWKAVVGWSVGLGLNSVWAVRIWVRQKAELRARHQALADKLDVRTPGGIADLAKIIKGEELEELHEDTDDNGSDYPDAEPPKRRFGRRGGHSGGPGHASTHGNFIMQGVRGGSSGASHR